MTTESTTVESKAPTRVGYEVRKGNDNLPQAAGCYLTATGFIGSIDECVLFAPGDRPMIRIGFYDHLDGPASAQRKADTDLIVNALNAYRPRKPRKMLSDEEKRRTKVEARIRANLSKPMPKKTLYKPTI